MKYGFVLFFLCIGEGSDVMIGIIASINYCLKNLGMRTHFFRYVIRPKIPHLDISTHTNDTITTTRLPIHICIHSLHV